MCLSRRIWNEPEFNVRLETVAHAPSGPTSPNLEWWLEVDWLCEAPRPSATLRSAGHLCTCRRGKHPRQELGMLGNVGAGSKWSETPGRSSQRIAKRLIRRQLIWVKREGPAAFPTAVHSDCTQVQRTSHQAPAVTICTITATVNATFTPPLS